MKLHYYPETDSLYIELKATPGTETREVATGLVVDLDEIGEVVGFDMDLASKRFDLLHTRDNRVAAPHDLRRLIEAFARYSSRREALGRGAFAI
jgi:uncharacterized protein YuzE